MTAYEYIPANRLSDFHDWQYEESSARADARDAALESFAQDWTADLVSDERCKVFTRIDEVMADAMSNLCFDGDKCERFNRLLFALWAGGTDCINQLRAMLETEMTTIMEHKFDKAPVDCE